MSLLTALLAFVPGALIARPEPEPEPESESLKAMTESRNKAARRVAELVDEIAVLKEKLRICEAARDAARADRDQSDAQLRFGRLQQQNQAALSAYVLGGMQQQGIACGQYNPCTCVPGRYDALRQEYPRVFDAGHNHGA